MNLINHGAGWKSETAARPMSASGQKQQCRAGATMSGIPSTPDFATVIALFSSGPETDIQ